MVFKYDNICFVCETKNILFIDLLENFTTTKYFYDKKLLFSGTYYQITHVSLEWQ